MAEPYKTPFREQETQKQVLRNGVPTGTTPRSERSERGHQHAPQGKIKNKFPPPNPPPTKITGQNKKQLGVFFSAQQMVVLWLVGALFCLQKDTIIWPQKHKEFHPINTTRPTFMVSKFRGFFNQFLALETK